MPPRPLEENACYYLGRVYYTLNRFEESEQAFGIALRNTKQQGRPLHGLALTLEALGKKREAEQRYREATRAGEKSAAADYGMFLFKEGRSSESIEIFRKYKCEKELRRVTAGLAASPAARPKLDPASVSLRAVPLEMTTRNGATGKKYLVETMIAGVAVLDYDNDGWPDIFVANGASLPSLDKTGPDFYNRLFHNNHDGSFSDVTAEAGLEGAGYSMGVAAADYDNDGRVDLFVTGVRANTLYRNRGDGTFENMTRRAGVGGDGQWSVAAAWLDYDNDGWLDLFVVHYVAWDPATELSCGV